MSWYEFKKWAGNALGYADKFRIIDQREYVTKRRAIDGDLKEANIAIKQTEDLVAGQKSSLKKLVGAYGGEITPEAVNVATAIKATDRALKANQKLQGKYVQQKANLETYMAFQKYILATRKNTSGIKDSELEKLYREFEIEQSGEMHPEPPKQEDELVSIDTIVDPEVKGYLLEATGATEASKKLKEKKSKEVSATERTLEEDLRDA